jgi:protoporphyrinogen oxidase
MPQRRLVRPIGAAGQDLDGKGAVVTVLKSRPRVVILGAGPAGVGAAYRLAARGDTEVRLVERQSAVGGNAGSFDLAGMRVDYGSHRLHHECEPGILADLRDLLGGDLVARPRRGRIRLHGRWIHFPLKPFDLLFHLPISFNAGILGDIARKPFRRSAQSGETFATVLRRGLGATICRDFYFPYAHKLWGLPANELSAEQARRRIAAGSIGKLVARALSSLPGLKKRSTGRFYYCRRGYGQISERLHEAATTAGAQTLFGTSVAGITHRDRTVSAVRVSTNGADHSLPATLVWSTIPITRLVQLMDPPAPVEIRTAASKIGFRSMILVYLVLEVPQFTEFDAHYFPEIDIPITRLSEPKNYSGVMEPPDATVLCAELPCSLDGEAWGLSDDALGELVKASLARAGLPIRAPVRSVTTRRLAQAYPIYRVGFEHDLALLDQWLEGFEGLLTFGRQGLFVHDNTHHALFMAYAAAECLAPDGSFDKVRWRHYRRLFDRHVVVD